MRFVSRRRFLCLAAVAMMLLSAATMVPLRAAAAAPAGAVRVREAWARWLPAGLPAAGYLTLVNDSDADAFVTAVTSPDYDHVMLHESYTGPGGTSGMRHVDRLRVPAHGSATLAPGGYHLMLMKPLRKLAPGDTVTVTLEFEDGNAIDAKLPLKPAARTE
jgi:copper(I)-binding protein